MKLIEMDKNLLKNSGRNPGSISKIFDGGKPSGRNGKNLDESWNLSRNLGRARRAKESRSITREWQPSKLKRIQEAESADNELQTS